MTVRELIEFLKTQDQEASVEVMVRQTQYFDGDTFSRVNFDPEKHAEYVDFRENPFAKGTPQETRRILFLGGDE